MGAQTAGMGRKLLMVVTAIVVCTLVGPALRAATYNPTAEQQARTLIASARKVAHVQGLKGSVVLNKMARQQAERIAHRGSLYHNPNLKSDATKGGLRWRSIGENVGYGRTAAELHTAFMRSSAHRANILRTNYNAYGLGVVMKGGRMYMAQVFAQLA